jgi:hypothetical protein
METILAMGVLGWVIGLVVGSPAALHHQRRREKARVVPWRGLVARGPGSGPEHSPLSGTALTPTDAHPSTVAGAGASRFGPQPDLP